MEISIEQPGWFEDLMAMCDRVHELSRQVDVILANRKKPEDPRDIMIRKLGGGKRGTKKPAIIVPAPYMPDERYIPGILHTLRDEAIEWFMDPRVKGNPISSAERKIIDELNQYRIAWHREVSFKGLILPTGGYARYDFYIPMLKLVIEYDGEQYHNTTSRIEVDDLKNAFCKKWKLDIVRLNKKHYYNMENTIAAIMKKYGIGKK